MHEYFATQLLILCSVVLKQVLEVDSFPKREQNKQFLLRYNSSDLTTTLVNIFSSDLFDLHFD